MSPKPVEHTQPLIGAERTEVAHDHRNQIKVLLRLEFQVASEDVVDGPALLLRQVACMPYRTLGEVDAGDLSPRGGQTRGVQPGAAAKVGDALSRGEFEMVGYPRGRPVDEIRRP